MKYAFLVTMVLAVQNPLAVRADDVDEKRQEAKQPAANEDRQDRATPDQTRSQKSKAEAATSDEDHAPKQVAAENAKTEPQTKHTTGVVQPPPASDGTVTSAEMEAVRSAGEAARAQGGDTDPTEAKASIAKREPRASVTLDGTPEAKVLSPVDSAHQAKGEEFERGARSSKSVDVPAYESGAQPPLSSDESDPEQTLREKVQTRLLDDQSLSRSEQLVRVNVQGHVVTLTGQVGTTYERDRVERKVRSMPGVREVKNEVRARNSLDEKSEWAE